MNQEQTQTKQDYSSQKLEKSHFFDTKFVKCNFSAADLDKSGIIDCRFEVCKFTGASFGFCTLENIDFVDCIFDTASFVNASFKRVRFTNCRLDDVLMSDLKVIKPVYFKNCQLSKIDLREAKLGDKFDLRSSHLESIWGIASLKNNIVITTDQINQLAPGLALEAGLQILDE